MCANTASLVFLFVSLVCKVNARNTVRESLVTVPFGAFEVNLHCESNDYNHNFLFWHVNDRGIIVGSTNSYDNSKFRYQVLSGILTVKGVSKEDEGVYSCVSRGVRNDDIKVHNVRMVVEIDWEEVMEDDPDANLARVAVVLGSLIVLSGVGYAGYRIWKTRYRHPSYLMAFDQDEDEEEAEELFRAPGTSGTNKSILKTESAGFETPGINTDFGNILDTATKK